MSLLIRQVPLSSDPDSATFMIMTLLFDPVFKEWFCGLYMRDMVRMMDETADLMFSEENIAKIKEKQSTESDDAGYNFVNIVAERYLRSELRAELRQRRRQEEGRDEDSDEEDSDEEGSDENEDEEFEIPDTEEIRQRRHLLRRQIRQQLLRDGRCAVGWWLARE